MDLDEAKRTRVVCDQLLSDAHWRLKGVFERYFSIVELLKPVVDLLSERYQPKLDTIVEVK